MSVDAEVTAHLGQVAVAQDHPWGLITTRRCRAVMAWADATTTVTVEAHLRHAYAKMGVRSRSHLARRLTENQ